MKPVIGLNADYRPGCHCHAGEVALSEEYLDRIATAGGLPLVLACPPAGGYDRHDVGRLLDRCAGLVLVGGDDQDPLNDGFYRHAFTRCLPPRREAFDRLLVAAAVARKLPTLAIGAGAQLLNTYCGGTLFLHLPEERGRSRLHADSGDPRNRHALLIEPGNLLSAIWGEGEANVTSQHHQAIDGVAAGFAVIARAPDGHIEAILSTDEEWPALGVQFHPESRFASFLERKVFEWFLGQVRKKGRDEHAKR
jgi:putative glutamine amidotransferase